MENITCVQAEEWFSLKLDGVMAPGEERILQAHLDQCNQCRQKYELTSKIAAAMHQMPRVDCPDPNFSHHVINVIKESQPERKLVGSLMGRVTAWKKGVAAAAAAALIIAGSFSLSGGWTGIQLARHGPGDNLAKDMVAQNGDLKAGPTDNTGDVQDIKTPGTDTESDLIQSEPEPGKQPKDKAVDQTPATKANQDQPSVKANATTDATAKPSSNTSAPDSQETAPVVLTSNDLVAKSTTLKLMVDNAQAASAKAEALATAAGGKAQLLANQNTDQGNIQIMRIAVAESQSGALVGSLAELGSVVDRQQESRSMTSQYNKLAVRYNELAEAGDDSGTRAERASLKQQMNILSRDAQSHTVVLWIQQR